MKKTKGISKVISAILITAALVSMLALPAAAAPTTATVVLNTGEEGFSVALYVKESSQYAGIEFTLTISDADAMQFGSFTPAYAGANNAYVERDGQHFFGFFSESNKFGGPGVDDKVGTVSFKGYKGNQPVTLTLEMSVTRVVAGQQAVETITSPWHIITVQREQPGPNPPDAYYTVTFLLNGGIRIGGGDEVQSIREGDTPEPPAVSRTGFIFDGWDPDDFSKVHSNMTITAQWKADDGSGPGPGTPGPGTPGPGGPGPGGGTDTGTDPGSNIPDNWVPLVPGFPFTDVMPGTWYASDVLFMWERDLMRGTSATQFSPHGRVRRGMIVTVLYRMEGEPSVAGLDNPFTDVPGGMYYTDAVIWAAANEIVLGYGGNRFGPNDDVTREQLATMLYRYQEYKDEMAPDVNPERVFADAGRISGFATEPVAKLVKQGIINGKNNNMFDPKGNATRAEYAAMLHRYLLAVEEPEEELPDEGAPEEVPPEEELPEEGLPDETP